MVGGCGMHLPLITALLFAGSFVAARLAVFELEPLTITLLRYGVALVFLAVLARIRDIKLEAQPRHWVRLSLLGTFGILGYHYLFFISLRYTSVANTSIINAASPVITAVATALFTGERLKMRNYTGIALTLVGVLILICRGSMSQLLELSFASGDLLMMGAVVSWVIYALLIQKMLRHYDGFALTWYATLSAVLILLPLSFWLEHPLEQLQAISQTSIWAIIYMGVCASGLGYLYYNRAISRLGATKTSGVVYSVVPVLVAILAFIFFGESITAVMVASTLLIIFGLRQILAS